MSQFPKQTWSGPLSEDVDLCFHFYEDTVDQLTPVNPDDSLPLRNVQELPLVFNQPCFVQAGNQFFKIVEEGFYRFSVFPTTTHQRIFYRSNRPRFVGAIGQLHIHGWRENKKPVSELIENAKSRFVSVTCGIIREVGIELMSQQGIKARRVSTFTIDKWNTYNCGHALYEYFDPKESRWILADSDAGVMFRANGRWLDTDTVCRLNREGKPWDVISVATGFNLDLCCEHVEPQIAFYALSMCSWVNPIQSRRFFDRVFQVTAIGEDYTVDTPAQKGRFEALCGTAKLKYKYLPPAEFRAKYYSE
ncbi:MAG: hypothetical protein WC975_16450 [Phycisphaerae bacterium]